MEAVGTPDTFEEAVRLASHQLDTSPMITRRFTLNEFEAACDVFSRPGEMGALKVLLSSSKGITYRPLVLVEITKSGFYREPVARIHRRACAAAIAVA
jgi:hypothetical protein